jgi:universal stress protein A
MANYQHILISADFSEYNNVVMLRAKELAERNQAKLSICHIIEDFPIADFAYESMIGIDMDRRDALQKGGKQQLSALAKTQNIPDDNQWLELGSPGYGIVRLANENKVDLIIVGSHGRHGIKLLLGSTANTVLHHAKCDVLAVRLPED